jgi:terminase small subunit / prophage DNA-packing protein
MTLRQDLEQPCTQDEFGEMVGITQPSVSKLVTRGILIPGQTAQQWLDRYLTHLREVIIDRQVGRI